MSDENRDELREQLAQALARVDSDGVRLIAYVNDTQRYGLSRVADALLPVVAAYAEERQCPDPTLHGLLDAFWEGAAGQRRRTVDTGRC